MLQTFLTLFAFMVFIASLCVPLLLFVVNPLLLWLRAVAAPRPFHHDPNYRPSVSVICVFHAAPNLVVEKLKNLLELDYPSDQIDIVLYEDGASEEAARVLAPFLSERVRYAVSPEHVGKNHCLNEAVEIARGEVLVFTDVGAKLDRRAILEIAACFADPEVGGGFGYLSLISRKGELDDSQRRYWKLDSQIRYLENRTGSLTSNSGQISSIRKALWKPIPLDVTDDLYTCLTVVSQNRRFVFIPEAKAYIAPRSRDPRHEIGRRRRIINRSLHGIWRQRSLLNPFRYGFYSMHLFINKVLRRFLPVAGLFIFFSSLLLATESAFFMALFALQVLLLALTFSQPLLARLKITPRPLRSAASTAWYVLVGNWGVLLGLWDIIQGKRVMVWNATEGIEHTHFVKPAQ